MEPAAATASSSIFGGAKPVDTAKKEREIEEKLQKQHEEVKSRSRTQSERSGDENNKSNEEEKSSGGSAKDKSDVNLDAMTEAEQLGKKHAFKRYD